MAKFSRAVSLRLFRLDFLKIIMDVFILSWSRPAWLPRFRGPVEI